MKEKENLYNLETYNYSLPKELIAQYPCEKRDESRLLRYKKESGKIFHHIFYDLVDLFSKNDVLVLNNTKVIPARFFAVTENNKKIEILLVNSVSPDNLTWKILAKGLSQGRSMPWHASTIDGINVPSKIEIEFINTETIKFKSYDNIKIILEKSGKTPLPPYIKRDPDETDIDRYQTVFATEPGAIAAPTAALHFTEDLLEKIKKKGVGIFYITLHVGPGTFLPIRTNDIREHKLIPENFYIDQETWDKIQEAKKNKKRIVACGTTTVRALEYAARIKKLSGQTNLYIAPGFEFKIVDALITNFHLPKTTLLVLVSAFIGWENVKKIYEEAIKQKYRFYSYGDGMFVN